jgi:hypothetical protein
MKDDMDGRLLFGTTKASKLYHKHLSKSWTLKEPIRRNTKDRGKNQNPYIEQGYLGDEPIMQRHESSSLLFMQLLYI